MLIHFRLPLFFLLFPEAFETLVKLDFEKVLIHLYVVRISSKFLLNERHHLFFTLFLVLVFDVNFDIFAQFFQ